MCTFRKYTRLVQVVFFVVVFWPGHHCVGAVEPLHWDADVGFFHVFEHTVWWRYRQLPHPDLYGGCNFIRFIIRWLGCVVRRTLYPFGWLYSARNKVRPLSCSKLSIENVLDFLCSKWKMYPRYVFRTSKLFRICQIYLQTRTSMQTQSHS
jgi:hypothetical protein